jgi:hypothetical protein
MTSSTVRLPPGGNNIGADTALAAWPDISCASLSELASCATTIPEVFGDAARHDKRRGRSNFGRESNALLSCSIGIELSIAAMKVWAAPAGSCHSSLRCAAEGHSDAETGMIDEGWPWALWLDEVAEAVLS